MKITGASCMNYDYIGGKNGKDWMGNGHHWHNIHDFGNLKTLTVDAEIESYDIFRLAMENCPKIANVNLNTDTVGRVILRDLSMKDGNVKAAFEKYSKTHPSQKTSGEIDAFVTFAPNKVNWNEVSYF